MSSRRVSVAACHATGKSFALACLALVFAMLYPDSRVLVITPGWLMNRAVIWSEIFSILERAPQRLPIVSQTQTELRFGPKNLIIGLSAADSGRLQGHHAEHLLVIIDEAAALDPTFWPAIEGVLASGDSRLIIAGNPTTSSGVFNDSFGRNRASFECIHIGAFDTENFAGLTLAKLLAMDDAELDTNPRPYLISRRWVRERHREWFNGSPENSPLWQSRVLGVFPTESSNALIPLAALEAARRPAQARDDRVVIGVDPAGPGRDRTVAIACAGGAIVDVGVWTDSDSRGPVLAFIKKHPNMSIARVDSIGIGFHFASHIRDQGYRCEGVNVAKAADDSERFANLKAQRFWHLRERFITGQVSGLSDEMLAELACITYNITPLGKIAIEEKESVRSQLGRSPDLAEALMLAIGDVDLEPWTYTPVPLLREGETRRFVGGRKLTIAEQDAIDDRKPATSLGSMIKSRRWGPGAW